MSKIKNPFNRNNEDEPKPPNGFNLLWLYFAVFLIVIAFTYLSNYEKVEEINWRSFQQEMLTKGHVEQLVVINNEYVEVYIRVESLVDDVHKSVRENKRGPHYSFTIGSVDFFQQQLQEAMQELPDEKKISPSFEKRENWFANVFSWLLPILLVLFIWLFIFRRLSNRMAGMGGSGENPFMDTGKSKAQLFEGKDKIEITFDDVAGLDEAKEEIMEVVDFLKHPDKYKKLGAKIPKGVLLTGPPGTGKTLMAKAMAGEAGVPFFSISGSDFVEMFVGVGAARVRDLFKKGREKAPCIIFIDEIEAIGRSRSRSVTQTNDERENTLNQLLVEMDGFSSEKTVIILAATNRPDLLDSALLRPGRFDRQILIDKPDLNGRTDIFKVHLRKLVLSDEVSARTLAEQTPGFAGAEIANVCNEAALHAARKKKDKIEMEDFNSALDRVIGGLEKKNKLISPREKEIIAYHETGHAVAGWFLEHAHPLVKVSIVPRGMAALGFAQYLPKEQNLYTRNELLDAICMTLGGRVAEELVFGDISTGAQNDLERTTQLVYAMISLYGMNKLVGPVSFKELQNEYALRQPYSDDTAHLIDDEARKLLAECYERTRALLSEYRDKMDDIAKELLEKEILYKTDFERILGERPFSTFELKGR
jgi:AFG3 family protein